MTTDEFHAALSTAMPPGLSPALQALWYDGKGDWAAAHRTVQDADDRAAAWVHAYLHRKEGDTANAGYWYRRAGQPAALGTLEEEWTALVRRLLDDESKDAL